MPNDVYGLARRELAAMVSVRAAERVLDAALASVKVSPDEVTARQMRALVSGPIQKDLRAILPRAGLGTVLRGLTDDLRAMASPTPRPASAPDASTRDARAAQAAPAAVPDPAAGADARPPAHAPLLDADLDAAALERLALAFARLDDVVGVAVVREGRVRFARGAGFDPERAALMVPVAAGVMGRHGSWRSYALVHDQGQLFVVPVGRDHLVLAGRPELNLGAVLAALARLEEAL